MSESWFVLYSVGGNCQLWSEGVLAINCKQAPFYHFYSVFHSVAQVEFLVSCIPHCLLRPVQNETLLDAMQC